MVNASTLPITESNDNVLSNIGIIVALPEELRTLTQQAIKQGECLQLGSVWIVYSGAGWQNATTAAQLLIAKGVQRLVSWGCAAGLVDTLKPGDLVLASQIVGDDKVFETDKLWRDQLQQQLSPYVSTHSGSLFTSRTLVSSHQAKQQIHQKNQAIALDMESAAIAEVAENAHLPCLVIRSIADPVSQNLPQAVLKGLNANGQVELPRLLRHLCWHPGEVVELVKLGLHFHAAQKTLKTVTRHLRLLEQISS